MSIALRQAINSQQLKFVSLVALMGCGLTWRTNSVRAHEPIHYSVVASWDEDESTLDYTVKVEVRVDPSSPELRFWMYADRNSVTPSSMDERSGRWIYPTEVDHGEIHMVSVLWNEKPVRWSWDAQPLGKPDGRDFKGSDIKIATPRMHRAQEQAQVTMHIRIKLPSRFGRLGRARGQVSFAAPWYPLLLDASGSHRHVTTHDVTLHVGRTEHALVGNRHFVGTAHVVNSTFFVPMIVAQELVCTTRDVDGVSIRYWSTDAPYAPPQKTAQGTDALQDIVRIDTMSLIRRVVKDALQTLRFLRVPITTSTLDIVAVPSRTELTGSAPGWVMVSDRLYQVFPLQVVRGFHDDALRRAVFRRLIEPLTSNLETPRDQGWADDVRAVALVDVDRARRRGNHLTPRDLVGWAAFHPTIDQLLYAPQIPFEHILFGSVDERDTFREDPDHARHPIAGGRRILESARDAMTHDEFREWMCTLLSLKESIRDVLAATRRSLAAALQTWLNSPLLKVNYRLGRITSEKLAPREYRYHVEIVRDGDARQESVPVELRDKSGHVYRKNWNGESQRGVVVFFTTAPMDRVALDPEGRLTQSSELTEGHPRYDDATTHPWRPPLLRGYALNFFLTEKRITGFVDFAMRRKYDLEHAITAALERTAQATGGSIFYVQGVGPKRHTNARIGSVSGGLNLDRLHSGFVKGAGGGWRLAAIASAGFDTRTYFIDPRRGNSLGGAVRLAGVRRDDGTLTWNVSTSTRGSWTIPWGLRNATLFVGGAGWTWGRALPSEKQSLGGQLVMRGFQSGELVGRGRVYAVMEHRFTIVSDMAWNLLHLAWLREIQLAAFAGGGVLFKSIDGRDVVGAADAGAGVRFHFDYGGIQPGLFSIDMGVPLTRKTDLVYYNGIAIRRRPPFNLYVAFDQYF